MNTAVIVTKTDPAVKSQAQKLAAQMGFSLSALINGYLRQFTRTKTVHFSMQDEEPSEYLQKVMRQAEKNRQAGKGSPVFSDAKSAVGWLEKQGI